jgi:hypothetical protein
MRRFSSTILAGFILFSSFGTVRADESTVVLGQQEIESFKGSIALLKPLSASDLPLTYEQAKWSLRVHFPKQWTTTDHKKTSTKLETWFTQYPSDDPSAQDDGIIILRAIQRPKAVGVADVDPYFDQIANLKPQETIGDWYIPSMGALERSDITMSGQNGRQFLFMSSHEVPYIGVVRIIAIDKTFYALEMFHAAKGAPAVYKVYDAMSKDLTIGKSTSSAKATTKSALSSLSSKATVTAKSSSSTRSRRSVRSVSRKSSVRSSSLRNRIK